MTAMQLLDIAVASGYAALCLSLIVVISPVVPHETAVEAANQIRLDHAISAYVAAVGLPFLTTSSPAAICGSGSQATNSTIFFAVFVRGVGCPSSAAPRSPLSFSSFALVLPGRTVVVQAWLERQ